MPQDGPSFACKRSCTLKYKCAIRRAKKLHDNDTNEILHENLVHCDSNAFWKIWRNENRANESLVTRVDGEMNEKGIADAFAVHFQGVYSGGDSSAHQSLKSEFEAKFSAYHDNQSSQSISPFLFFWTDITNVISKLENGKSTSSMIKPEHVLNSSVKLAIHLHLFFNAMIQHGYVVNDFLQGTITPIIKNTEGDVSSSSNYRGITLGTLFSKMFEIALDAKISPYLNTDDLQ